MHEPGHFYVAYTFCGLRYLAKVNAPGRPLKTEFGTYEEFRDAMDELGHLCSMKGETPDPIQYGIDDAAVWEKQLTEVKEIIVQDQMLPDRRSSRL